MSTTPSALLPALSLHAIDLGLLGAVLGVIKVNSQERHEALIGTRSP
jgi:hypothetical protein